MTTFITDKIDRNSCNGSEAEKLSGYISWATSKVFDRIGRSYIQPMYSRVYMTQVTARLSQQLLRSLLFWAELFSDANRKCPS